MKLSPLLRLPLAALAVASTLLATAYRPAPAFVLDAPTTRLVSLCATGSQGSDASGYPAISGDGRWVAFASDAPNLVTGDTNGSGDIFVKDMTTGALVCASISAAGTPAEGESFCASISADGLRVAFASEAPDLVAGDQNRLADVFVRDLAVGTTTRLSVSPAGEEANRASLAPRMSADGHCVVFVSTASNLVAGDTNGASDVFLCELAGSGLELVSAGVTDAPADAASEGAALSADGRFVAFSSMARDLVAGESQGDASRVWQVYRRDRQSGTTARVSVSLAGGAANGSSYAPAMSADGRWIAFASAATDLISSDLDGQTDIFLRDMNASSIQRVSLGVGGLEPIGESGRPSISADGRYIAFESSATNLVSALVPPGSTWCYVRDMTGTSAVWVVSASPEPEADGGAVSPVLSADGHWVAFSSAEATLVTGDGNAREDVFLRGPLP